LWSLLLAFGPIAVFMVQDLVSAFSALLSLAGYNRFYGLKPDA
jgi:hypothetical protein